MATIFETYSETFRKIYSNYENLKKIPIKSYSEYNESIRLQKRSEEAEKNRKQALSEIDNEIKKIEKLVSDKKEAKIKLKYPLFYFPNSKNDGLEEMTRAKNYLSTRRTSEKLLAEINNAIELERWDYVSAFVDELKTNRSENLQDNKVREEIFTRVNKLPAYKTISENETLIGDLSEVLQSASLLKSTIVQDTLPETKEYEVYQTRKQVGVVK